MQLTPLQCQLEQLLESDFKKHMKLWNIWRLYLNTCNILKNKFLEKITYAQDFFDAQLTQHDFESMNLFAQWM